MKSPFPGMDPYLERHWRDVHARLIVYISDQLQPQLGGALRARVEERLVVESPLDESREIYPDVRVFVSKPSSRTGAQAGTAVMEPLIVPCPDETSVETFIEIIDRSSGDKLITVIELLSPSNKLNGDSRKKYRQKQKELHAALVNLVEIDLTRAGRRRLMLPQAQIAVSHRTTFQACVFRAKIARPQFEVYRMPLNEALPPMAIPLREKDRDVQLDLQPLVERAYENGAYDDLDYSTEALPSLLGEDAEWADQLLREAGRR